MEMKCDYRANSICIKCVISRNEPHPIDLLLSLMLSNPVQIVIYVLQTYIGVAFNAQSQLSISLSR